MARESPGKKIKEEGWPKRKEEQMTASLESRYPSFFCHFQEEAGPKVQGGWAKGGSRVRPGRKN